MTGKIKKSQIKDGKIEVTLAVDLTEKVLEAVSNRIIEITNPDFFKDQETTYTVKEAARLADCTAQTIGNHIRAGILIATKVGKSYKITESNLKAYINGE